MFCFILFYFQRATKIFHTLDNRINSVATNVVHLGDQLEGINTPRQRAKDTLQLMEYFNEFLVEGTPTSTVFRDEAKVILTKKSFGCDCCKQFCIQIIKVIFCYVTAHH